MSTDRITYVHDGNEVYLTGRIATSSAGKPGPIVRMVEVVPVGADITYAKWVRMTELLTITDTEEI